MAQTLGSLRLPGRLAAALLLGATLLLGGCPVPERYPPVPPPASAPGGPRSTAPPTTRPASPMPAPAPGSAGITGSAPAEPRPPRDIRLSAATRSLVTQAHVQAAKGDVDAASATLDRALRIEPGNALLWIELGRLRLVENDARQAESCGRKALVLASGDARAQSQARQLLADALRAQGRTLDPPP